MKYVISMEYTVTTDNLKRAEKLAKVINDTPLFMRELELVETKDIVGAK